MPIISYVFSASFGAAIGALFGPLGPIAYVFALLLIAWCVICFLKSPGCDMEEFSHMAVPVGSGCVGLAMTHTPVIVWDTVVATLVIVIVAFFFFFCLKRLCTPSSRQERE